MSVLIALCLSEMKYCLSSFSFSVWFKSHYDQVLLKITFLMYEVGVISLKLVLDRWPVLPVCAGAGPTCVLCAVVGAAVRSAQASYLVESVRPSVPWGWRRHLDRGVRVYVCALVGDIAVGGGRDGWTLAWDPGP